MKIISLIGFILFVITQSSYSQNTKTEEVITIEEYGSSLDKSDYARYVENRDVSYLYSELGNTGMFHRILNLGNRKYFCVYTVYILPNQVNETTRDLSKHPVKSFEEWKKYEIQNEIERREEASSLKEELSELQSKLRQVYEKYIDKIISNNRELALGYVLGFIESEIFDIDRNNFKKWDVSEYKVLPNDDFIKFIDNPQHIEPKSGDDTVGYVLQVDVVKGDETLINLPFIINNLNDDWSYLNLQIGSSTFELDLSKDSELEKLKLINKIKDDYNIIEVSYNNFTNSGLRNHFNKLKNSFDILSNEFNVLGSSEFNYFNYGSSNEVWYTRFRSIRPGFFDTIDELKQISENNKIIGLNKINGLDINFNPTEDGRLNLERLEAMNFIEVQFDDLKTRLKNELKFHIKDEKLLNNVVDRISNIMIPNLIPHTKIRDLSDKKIFESIKIIKSTNSKLTFQVEDSDNYLTKYVTITDDDDKYLGRLYYYDYYWEIDFKKMKLELYESPHYDNKYKSFKNKLSSRDLN